MMQPELLPRPQPGPPPAPRVPRPERWTLANGLRIVAAPRRGLPQAVVRLVVPAGSVADPASFPGTASLVASLLTEGTGRRDAAAFNAEIDQLGASMSASAGHDFAVVEMVLLADTLASGLELLADAVMRASFPAAETERVRAETLDGILARDDEPANVADDRVAEAVFGTGHPYGQPTWGSAAAIQAVGRDTLRAFHDAHYRPDGGFMVVAGDFDASELVQVIEREFAGWRGAVTTPAVPAPPSLPQASGERLLVPWEDAVQAEIRVAGVGVARRSPDWTPAGVANYIIGGSTITSRLGANLREEKGWTYGIRSALADGLQPAGWLIETAVDVEVADDAVAEIQRELSRIVREPVPADELRRAKDALVLSLPRAFETPGRVVSRVATLEAYGLPDDYWECLPERIEAVTPADIQRVAGQYFAPEQLASVIVGLG